MKRFLLISFIIITVFLAACGNTATGDTRVPTDEQTPASAQLMNDAREASSVLSDWILGTNFGIISGSIDTTKKSVTLTLPADKLESLTGQDKQDIHAAIVDILSLELSPAAAREYSVQYQTEGTAAGTHEQENNAQASQEDRAAAANLIFIHHSVGENWLNDGLCRALNENGYHVADIYYGWREYGDHTDTVDWPVWFTDDVMNLVYREMNTMTAPNNIQLAAGENKIIMFKSCFPNSDVGPEISDEMSLYNGLLSYFERYPDKMFVLVTPPPMIRISNPAKTRELCDWLSDRKAGWLSELSTGNVFVFDFYNVLTHPDAHHQFLNGQEVHQSIEGANTLYYDSAGDDHPNKDGNVKATEEFIGLLNYWYQSFSVSRS